MSAELQNLFNKELNEQHGGICSVYLFDKGHWAIISRTTVKNILKKINKYNEFKKMNPHDSLYINGFIFRQFSYGNNLTLADFISLMENFNIYHGVEAIK